MLRVGADRIGRRVIVAAHNLSNPHVIHYVGPVDGDEPSGGLLAECYRNALLLAQDAGLGSVAFPAISTGVFG